MKTSTTEIVFLVLVAIINFASSVSVSYCDESNNYVQYSHSDCPGGISFGHRKPDCVCITGM